MLLIDSDFLAYKAAQACEEGIDFGDDVIVAQSNFSDVLKIFERELKKVTTALMEDEFILYFSSPQNFRKKISADYKGHRNRRKPLGYKRLVNYCQDNYRFVLRDGLEADDALGMDATKYPDKDTIIVSPDKDMRQIPGILWDMKNDVEEISKEEGDTWHLIHVDACKLLSKPKYSLLKYAESILFLVLLQRILFFKSFKISLIVQLPLISVSTFDELYGVLLLQQLHLCLSNLQFLYEIFLYLL